MIRDLILEKQDFTFLSWDTARSNLSNTGSFMKSCAKTDEKIIFYKLPSFKGPMEGFGNECINQLIVQRLFTILGINHLEYKLMHGDILIDGIPYDTFILVSDDFRKPGEDKIAFDCFYSLEHKENESPLNFCIRMGWESEIYRMFVGDFLILNRGRDGSNLEILRNKSDKSIKLAPLFGHSLSLLFYCKNTKQIESYDVMEDKQSNNFIGFRSTLNNLRLIPKDKLPKLHTLQETDKDIIMNGLDQILSPDFLEKTWEMIWKRWCYYEDFCNMR